MYLQLILMITVTAAAGHQVSVFVVRVGDEVTLPCKYVTDGQNKCNTTTWTLFQSSAVTLFEDGKFNLTVSDRLNVSAKCSLVIKKVTMKDVGRYTCSQLTGQQRSNSPVYLSVVLLTEQKTNISFILSCSVMDYEFNRHTVEWLHEGEGETSSHSEPSPPFYRSTAVLTTSLHQNSTFFSSTKCKVTNILTKEVQLFTFSHQPTDHDAEHNADHNADHDTGWTWWHIVVSVASAAILIIILLFIKWKKTKGSEIKKEENTQEPILQPEGTVLDPETSEAMVEPAECVYYASVCYAKRKKQVHSSEDNYSPGDTAVYAEVKKKTETDDVTE
ncbi:uncharacterized protein LOC129375367 [Poeciliopsis prolifica]|uniref:uncharacterized protein LOC129375367 n=1 Tax=Poeciliopsis prolifica TaxID=188132 RepID=UPI00241316BF|nr:uncharacterized protein LOC129375367 [Poeciliopsis prolifica]